MRVMQQFNEAVTFAQSHEIPWPRDPTADLARWGVHHNDPPPFNRLRGPVQVEHYRHVSHDPKPAVGTKGELRPLREPGSYWEYRS